MYVGKVTVRNTRGFNEVDLDLTRPDGSCAGWTVLAGRNGSGKTTLPKAIALALAGPTTARRLMESFAGWIRESSREATVEVQIEPPTDRFTSELPFQAFLWAGLKWSSVAGNGTSEAEPQPRRAPHAGHRRTRGSARSLG